MSPKIALVGGLAVLIAVLGLGFILGTTQTEPTPPAEPPSQQMNGEPEPLPELPEEKPEERPHIARDTVENLYYGLSYEQAEELFGFASDYSESEYDPGVEGYTSPFVILWHEWENEDGSKARLGFVNNRMERKQFIEPDGTAALPDAPHLDVDSYGDILGIEE